MNWAGGEDLDKGVAKGRYCTTKNNTVSKEGKESDFHVDNVGLLRYQGRLCVPNNDEQKTKILKEAHHNINSISLGNTKMYQALR